MTRPRPVYLLLLLALSVATGDAFGAAPPQEPGLTQLEAFFWAAIGSQGATYRRFRDSILALQPAPIEFLEKRAKEGTTWQERTMAWILLERIQKGAQVERLLNATPNLRYVRSIDPRVFVYSEALATGAKACPMVLVEYVWKGNRLAWKRERETDLYALLALGQLKEYRATCSLIEYLEKQILLTLAGTLPSPKTRADFSCKVLGDLGDPQAVPVLLLACLASPGAITGFGREALGKCMDKRSIRVVSQAQKHAESLLIRKLLGELIQQKEAEFAAQQGQRTPGER